MAAGRKYLTREGFEALREEYDRLYREERPRVVQRISDAAAEGDRSENAEYIYGRKRLRELDARLRYLDGLLKDAVVVDRGTIRSGKVCFGATVLVETGDGRRERWTLVGEGETAFGPNRVSIAAPLGRALLGARVGDVVTVRRPAGELELEILDIRFGD